MFPITRATVKTTFQTTVRRLNSTTSTKEPNLPKKLPVTPNKYNAKSSAFNLKPVLPEGLFYHPAPAAPTPKLTPKAFLPDSDPRKTSKLYFPEETTKIKENLQYMPVLSKAPTPHSYHMTAKDVEELQKLRDQGVSRSELKKKFKVSNHFISISTRPSQETLKKEKEQLDKVVKKWSKGTRAARELREKEKVNWYRG
ncbi:unnamed protein product [Ambrosiozyma monospora]|uniref:Unnamed protein product n=1 Tax=Ambrosiozyma monospora TaxID=43982 RepID=A0A9W6YT00_AMBMO|nr:unnamed protein product [Ambrosiozyma monospora]